MASVDLAEGELVGKTIAYRNFIHISHMIEPVLELDNPAMVQCSMCLMNVLYDSML